MSHPYAHEHDEAAELLARAESAESKLAAKEAELASQRALLNCVHAEAQSTCTLEGLPERVRELFAAQAELTSERELRERYQSERNHYRENYFEQQKELAEVRAELQLAMNDTIVRLSRQLQDANKMREDAGASNLRISADCAKLTDGLRAELHAAKAELEQAERTITELRGQLDARLVQLSERREELRVAKADARRMHYLGNLVRIRSSDEQVELNALMRKYPPLAEPPTPPPAATEAVLCGRMLVDGQTSCGRCILPAHEDGPCQAWRPERVAAEPRIPTSPFPEVAKASAEEPAWQPRIREIVRFIGSNPGAATYTVRGIDTKDRTACILCDDGNQPQPGWVSWDAIEPADSPGRAQAGADQDFSPPGGSTREDERSSPGGAGGLSLEPCPECDSVGTHASRCSRHPMARLWQSDRVKVEPDYVTRGELAELLPEALRAWGSQGNSGFRAWLELAYAERGWELETRRGQ
jgi:hypothetical protein